MLATGQNCVKELQLLKHLNVKIDFGAVIVENSFLHNFVIRSTKNPNEIPA